MLNTSLKKGDNVQVISGDDKGKKGKILKIFPLEDRETFKVIVEGVNFVKRHTRPNKQAQQGGIIQKEAPMYVAKLMLICPRCNKPTKIGKKTLKDGKKSRMCKKCSEVIE
ncbi:MAG: 50S ribosomal protein L24 [Candidatus Firestonebacteria bacterium]